MSFDRTQNVRGTLAECSWIVHRMFVGRSHMFQYLFGWTLLFEMKEIFLEDETVGDSSVMQVFLEKKEKYYPKVDHKL